MLEQAAKKSVLLVEDDEEISFLIDFMLQREGFEVIQAPDGREAFEKIDRIAPPSLVLLDIMLPYRDGFQVIEHLRSKADWADVPVIMLTAKTQEDDIVRALNAGANDYVTKPFQPVELLARLRRLIKNPGVRAAG